LDRYVPRKAENTSAGEFRKLLYVHALWACRRHPYIESLPTLIHTLCCSCSGNFDGKLILAAIF